MGKTLNRLKSTRAKKKRLGMERPKTSNVVTLLLSTLIALANLSDRLLNRHGA